MTESMIVCPNCTVGCALQVTAQGGKIQKIRPMPEHPLGRICMKGVLGHRITEHPDRLRRPLLRRGTRLVEASWDEALGFIADKLADLKARYGPQSLAVTIGDPVGLRESRHIARWFCHLYGSPNMSSTGSFCHFANVAGMEYTFGHHLNANLRGANCLVVWGKNHKESLPIMVEGMEKRMAEGMQVIVIDPRRTLIAGKASLHLQIRPGTDGALALAMLNVVIGEGLHDREFVEKWTVGFPELAKGVAPYTPEWAADITGVSADLIRRAARIYASGRPSTIAFAVVPEHNPNAFQTVRAIACLIGVTGNVDVMGGNTYQEHLPPPSFSLSENYALGEAIGQREFPVFWEVAREGQAVLFYDLMGAQGPKALRALMVQATNPISTWPNVNRLREALGRLDLLVVMDLFMTETAELAHVVLPAATILEKTDLCDHGFAGAIPLVSLSAPVMEAAGQAWPDWRFWFELARRLGFNVPWNTVEDAFVEELAAVGVTLDQLREKPWAWYRKRQEKKYLEKGFPTPSGKVELFSQHLVGLGYSPLPTFTPPLETLPDGARVAKEYPLVLTTGSRILPLTHSQFRQIEPLRKMAPDPVAEIHPVTASQWGVADGEMIVVRTQAGEVTVKASITTHILEGVVDVAHGWPGQGNVNLLTSHQHRDPITGYPSLKWIPCRLAKAG